ncbi:sigma-E processing peptidase SpoIIGA [Anaerobranca californiensis DSM 14826]|jgi:stage II sporulation protein GA (sporulation sigma-E factor processing peptidase)|uniref:Sigma-E processing peptidase SpoIIGA n=1 Tax=Anaerobranca californiensis DSM 14826 TaxID=1120989 RepID=A0A1M6KTV8_9FIRM|nr:sigma-E processing peptidase SpoIIGA [Anaerobranca californiensis]SHJ62383.1 sigma-E processing peptidase SpoIIGA [Anaerobranca californiensis DSM 14826]
MKIYLDLTFIVNFFLCLTVFMLHDFVYSHKTPLRRKILASLFGSVYSILLVLYPKVFTSIYVKGLFFLLLGFIAFPIDNIGIFLKKLATLFVISFLGAGILYWFMIENIGFISIINPVISLREITKITLFLSGLVIFIPLTRVFILNVKNIFNNKKMYYQLEISIGKEKVIVRGFLDTGNSIYDPITKLPVIIVNAVTLKNLLGPEWNRWLETGYIWEVPMETQGKVTLIPFKSMGGEELLVTIKADKVKLLGEKKLRSIV